MVSPKGGTRPATRRKKLPQIDPDPPNNTTSASAETSPPGHDELEMELTRLKFERGRMIALLEEVQVQRDEAISRLNHEIETYDALKQELRKVKEEEKSRNEEVARLSRVISDSLSSLANKTA